MACIAPNPKRARKDSRRTQKNAFTGKPLAWAFHVAGIPILDTAQVEHEMAEYKENHCRNRAAKEHPITARPASRRTKIIIGSICFLALGVIYAITGMWKLPLLIKGLYILVAVAAPRFPAWLADKNETKVYLNELRRG